jgi:hypothetical protein
LVLRDKDMIIASGSEVRICSLAGESFPVIDGAVGAYRVSSLASHQKAGLMDLGAQVRVLEFWGRITGAQSHWEITSGSGKKADRSHRTTDFAGRREQYRRPGMPVCALLKSA